MVNWRSYIMTMLYPSLCPGCGDSLLWGETWCNACRRQWGIGRRIQRTSAIPHVDSVYCVASYRGPVGRGLRRLKYRRHLGNQKAWQELLDSFPFIDRLCVYSFVMPIPLVWQRQAERGFNQSEWLFRPWAKRQGICWLDGLQRIRKTQEQYGLKRKARQENLKSAFAMKGSFTKAIYGKKIILVDDIYTTGATMEACASVLKKHGASTVIGLVVASNAP